MCSKHLLWGFYEALDSSVSQQLCTVPFIRDHNDQKPKMYKYATYITLDHIASHHITSHHITSHHITLHTIYIPCNYIRSLHSALGGSLILCRDHALQLLRRSCSMVRTRNLPPPKVLKRVDCWSFSIGTLRITSPFLSGILCLHCGWGCLPSVPLLSCFFSVRPLGILCPNICFGIWQWRAATV